MNSQSPSTAQFVGAYSHVTSQPTSEYPYDSFPQEQQYPPVTQDTFNTSQPREKDITNGPSPEQDGRIDEEPLYVNAKQYFRILKRRVARARLEEVHRLSRQRKVSSYSGLFYTHSLIAYLTSHIYTNHDIYMPCVGRGGLEEGF